MKLISPHGGTLINRYLSEPEHAKWISTAASLPKLKLGTRTDSDLELIANGAYSPLEGFLGEADYTSVVNRMRLANGLPWSIPVTFPVSSKVGERLMLVAT